MSYSTVLCRCYQRLFPIIRPLGYEKVYLPPYKVADTPFHIQGEDIYYKPHPASNIPHAEKVNVLYVSLKTKQTAKPFKRLLNDRPADLRESKVIYGHLGIKGSYLPLHHVADTTLEPLQR